MFGFVVPRTEEVVAPLFEMAPFGSSLGLGAFFVVAPLDGIAERGHDEGAMGLRSDAGSGVDLCCYDRLPRLPRFHPQG